MTTPISIANLEIRLSGGSGNTNPSNSLGGDLSSQRVLSQSTSALSNITGVVIDYASGNQEGSGTLAYTHSTTSLTWTPYNASAGTPVNVTSGGDGRYTIFGSEGELLVTVTGASLPGSDKSDSVTVANITNLVWDDISKQESFAGDTTYRCVYLKNTHATDPFLDVSLFIAQQPTPGTISVGADPAGTGDGTTRSVSSLTRSGSTATATSTAHGYQTGQSVRIAGADQTQYNGVQTITRIDADNFSYTVSGTPATPATGTITCARGVPLTVTDENTPPSGVTFTSPSGVSDAIDFGQLNAGESVAFWTKRTIPARNTVGNTETVTRLSFPAYF